ncbi:hypothetical protein EDWATA_02095 [Edwardsiella tarda ATCC 23685]|uniref:Uncharacterized protein n=1 Tax=Edwardsiella tarda ATCC 23685 TaxID=500638 RepID=D4F5R7_EDWTA|nr:hypothetical protein EDWATA_02095 [Edwardsiella tarda ATCC 23685]
MLIAFFVLRAETQGVSIFLWVAPSDMMRHLPRGRAAIVFLWRALLACGR